MNALFVIVSAIVVSYASGALVCNAPHEVHSEFTPLCPRNCNTNKMVICLGVMKKESCQCEVGYIRKSAEDQTCIKEEECPNNEVLLCAGEHEFRSNYTPVCPVTCDTLNKVHCQALLDRPSCQCSDGTVRDTKTNKCVPMKECSTYYENEPIVCNGLNEKYSEYVSACPPTCAHKVGPICAAIIRKPSCVCVNGTVRDTVNSVCLKPEECPIINH